MTLVHHSPLRVTTPTTRVNDAMHLSADQWAVINAHSRLFVDKTYRPSTINESIINQFNPNFLSHSFVYLITETVGDYPYPYFTEKTWKAMISSTPFMLIGAKHSLQQLREFGFKTFDQWWCEDYDNHTYVADRINLVTLELKKLCALDQPVLMQYRQEMQYVVEYNRLHLINFRDADLKNIQMALQST
jgi:hypothetical protein